MALNEIEAEGPVQEKATSRDVLRDIINTIPNPPDGLVFKGTKSTMNRQGKEISRANNKVEVLALKKQKAIGAKIGGRSETGQRASKSLGKENQVEICNTINPVENKEGVECRQGKGSGSWYQMAKATDTMEQEKAENLDPGESCGTGGFI